MGLLASILGVLASIVSIFLYADELPFIHEQKNVAHGPPDKFQNAEKKSVTKKPNLNFNRLIKSLSFDQSFFYMSGLNLFLKSMLMVFCSTLKTYPC